MSTNVPAGSGTALPTGKIPARKSVTVIGATAIGVGGMMGAGVYTLLGLSASIAGVWIPIAFAIGGLVSAFSVYSYAKLGARYPSRGGAGEFLVRCFGDGLVSGGLNIFQFLGWIIAMSLYAVGFGGYAAGFIPGAGEWVGKAFGLGLIVIIVLVNMLGSGLVSKSEMVVVAIELVILAVFVGFAASAIDPGVPAHLRQRQRRAPAGAQGDRREGMDAGARGGAQPRPVRPAARLHDRAVADRHVGDARRGDRRLVRRRVPLPSQDGARHARRPARHPTLTCSAFADARLNPAG